MSAATLILGLDEIGASIGLALAEADPETTRIGFDPDGNVARAALDAGAINRRVSKPARAAETADLVVLNLPLDQTHDILKSIGLRLKGGAVVLNTSPNKRIASNWAADTLQDGCHYVGIKLVVEPKALSHTPDYKTEPRADLFRGGLMGIGTPLRAEKAAIDAATSLAHHIGATPFFLDPSEMDGMMAALDDLPVLLGLSLMRSTAQSPGWRDMQRLAGARFASATAPAMDIHAKALAASFSGNREDLIHRLDAVLDGLQDLRQLLAQDDHDGLVSLIEDTQKARASWIAARYRDNWGGDEIVGGEIPKSSPLSRMFGLGPHRAKE